MGAGMTESAAEKRPETLTAKPTVAAEKSEILATTPITPPAERPETLTATPTLPKATILSFTGFSNGPFVIVGSNFGESRGALTLAGKSVIATAWRDNRVKGVIPGDLQKGSAEISINGVTSKVEIT